MDSKAPEREMELRQHVIQPLKVAAQRRCAAGMSGCRPCAPAMPPISVSGRALS